MIAFLDRELIMPFLRWLAAPSQINWFEWIVIGMVPGACIVWLVYVWFIDRNKRKYNERRNLIPDWEADLDKRCRTLEGQ